MSTTVQIKLTRRQRSLLLEAMRRYQLRPTDHLGGEELTKAWTGLGYHTDYKPVLDAGLMEWALREPAFRCLGWLRLTESGARIVEIWLDYQAYLDEEVTK